MSKLLSIIKDKFCSHTEKLYSHYCALEMGQLGQTRTSTALSAIKTCQICTKVEVWEVALSGPNVEQDRIYWTKFSVNTIRTKLWTTGLSLQIEMPESSYEILPWFLHLFISQPVSLIVKSSGHYSSCKHILISVTIIWQKEATSGF